jgi:hypothetical protein
MKFKIPICVAILDLFLFLLLFRSGIVLPVINPSVEQHKQRETVFPRDSMQKILWISVHSPTSAVLGESPLGERFLALSVVQPVLIGFAIGWYIDKRRGVKTPFRFNLRSILALVTIVCVLCFLLTLAIR